MVDEGTLLWAPSSKVIADSNLTRFADWLGFTKEVSFADYEALWRWSVENVEDFWQSIWSYADVIAEPTYRTIRSGTMPYTIWFDGARLNFAEHLLRHEAAAPDAVAIHHGSEHRPMTTMTWTELGDRVRTLATALRRLGIAPGDRVVSCMPNIVETAIAMIATTAIGAVWSSVAPEFGARAILDRFGQIEPKLLFVVDGYSYGGAHHSFRATTAEVVEGLSSVEHVVALRYLDEQSPVYDDRRFVDWRTLMTSAAVDRETFAFTRVARDHALWILYSSGTTGLPKAIIHDHAGIVLELLRSQLLSMEAGPGSTIFFYTTTGWVVWNTLVGGLIVGASIVLYDGQPIYPSADRLWDIASLTGTTDLGLSPGLVARMEQAAIEPGRRFDLSALSHVVLFGAPASAACFAWFYEAVKKDLWVVSQAGSTELCAGIAGGVRWLPVRAGADPGTAAWQRGGMLGRRWPRDDRRRRRVGPDRGQPWHAVQVVGRHGRKSLPQGVFLTLRGRLAAGRSVQHRCRRRDGPLRPV